MFTRREFGKMTLASLPVSAGLAARLDSTVSGVRLGVQTYSYRDLPISGTFMYPGVIAAMTQDGLAECELFAQQVEPPNPATNFWSAADPKTLGSGADGGAYQEELRAKDKKAEIIKAREDLRKWRLETPLDHFRTVRKQFDNAGINVYAYNLSFNDSFTDDEIDRGFQQAKALGVDIITASTTLSVAKRVVPFAEKHKMYVAVHNHANLKDPNEFATPASLKAAVASSNYIKINLDIGHFTAANFDAVSFIRENHDHITNLHIKDRKKNGGQNTEWGQGDTPIKAVLQLLKANKYPIPAYIEYEYPGKVDCVAEVKKCFNFCKAALA